MSGIDGARLNALLAGRIDEDLTVGDMTSIASAIDVDLVELLRP